MLDMGGAFEASTGVVLTRQSCTSQGQPGYCWTTIDRAVARLTIVTIDALGEETVVWCYNQNQKKTRKPLVRDALYLTVSLRRRLWTV